MDAVGGGLTAAYNKFLQDPDKLPSIGQLAAKQIGDEFSGRQVRPAFGLSVKNNAPPVSPNMLDYNA